MTDLFNQPEINIPFSPVHKRENSAASELNLNEHRRKFNHDCFEVLQKLVNGERLTVRGAILSNLSGDLRRRIKDLKDYGISISDEWIGTGRSQVKVWFMSPADKASALEFLINHGTIKAA